MRTAAFIHSIRYSLILFLFFISLAASAVGFEIIPYSITSSNNTVVPSSYMNDSNLATGGNIQGCSAAYKAETINITANFSGVPSEFNVSAYLKRNLFYGGSTTLYMYNYSSLSYNYIDTLHSFDNEWDNKTITNNNLQNVSLIYSGLRRNSSCANPPNMDIYEIKININNTDPTVPTLTSNLTLNEVNHTPAVNFTKGTDADGDTVTTYIYVDGNNPPTTLETITFGSSVSIGSNTTLTDGSTYYIRGRSWDGADFSDYSAVDTFRMNSKPSVPALSSPTNNQTVTTSTVILSWSASSDSENDPITYDWQVNGTTQGTGVTGLAVNKTLPEATHNWSSRAYDGYEYSNWAMLNTFYIVLMPGYIYNTACTHGATWTNCTWSDPLLNFDHLVITNKTGTNNTWDSNVSAGVQYKNWTGLTKGQYNYSTQAAGTGGVLNNTIIWLNTTVNDYTFNFTGKTISSPSIDQGSGTETISVNANDSDGNITNMTVTITYFGVPFTYNMTHGAGDSWSYDFKTSNVGAYYVASFNATDDYGETSGMAWGQSFIVTPVMSGGSSPGGSSPSVSTTTSIPTTTTTLPIVSTINLKTMQNDETGQLILYGGLGIGALMMIWGAIGKRTTTGTLIWGLIIMVVSAYGLGLIS